MNKLYVYAPLFMLLGIGNLMRLDKGWLPGAWSRSSPLPVQAARSMYSLGCVDTVWISLGADCKFSLTPEVAMKGNLSVCPTPEDIRIVVSDANPLNGSIIDGPGVFRYAAFLVAGSTCTAFQSCHGVVVAEDKMPPILTAPADIVLDSFCGGQEFFFNRISSLSIGGKAILQDNCSALPDTVSQFRDEILSDNRCDSLVILRTFRAKDRAGNTAQANQRITLIRPRVSDFGIATSVFVDAGCNQSTSSLTDTAGNIAPQVAGLPYLINDLRDTFRLSPGDACGFSAIYRDERFTVCRNTYKIIRHWTIQDWCRNASRILEQHIIVGDVTSPIASCPAGLDTLRISVSPFNCRAALEIPAPVIKEACGNYSWAAEIWADSLDWAVSGSGSLAQVVDPALVAVSPFGAASRIVTGVPAGCHRLVYRVRDECQNETLLTCRICVADLISPIALAQNRINVTLDGSGFARLLPEEVNRGSRDNCSLVKLEIRRKFESDTLTCTPAIPYYGSWGGQVEFSCCDAGKSVLVELRATDASGNSNITWATILVEDKSLPLCLPPKDTAINCLELPPGFSPTDSVFLVKTFGNPLVSDNCGASIVAMPSVVNIEQCGNGIIKRRFQALDKSGNRSPNVCEQTITLNKAHRYSIRFPKDAEYQCRGPEPESVLTFGSGCDLLAVRVTEKKYGPNGKTCQQIFKTFEVINWCEYDGTSAPVEVTRDADCNGIAGDQDVWVMVRPDGSSYLDADNDEQNSFPAAGSRGSSCGGSNPRGYWTSNTINPSIASKGFWRYTQVITIQDTIPPKILTEKEVTLCADDNCSVKAFISVGLEESCSEDAYVSLRMQEIVREDSFLSVTQWERFGRYPKYLFAGSIPVGFYLIEVTARDYCGNVSTSTIKLTVADCRNPTVACLEGLTTQLSSLSPPKDLDGDDVPDRALATVWVSDFIRRSAEDCSFPLKYSINRLGESPDINRTSLVLTCKDRGFLPVEVHVWDNAQNPFAPETGGKNRGTCLSHVLVQDDPANACGIPGSDSYDISGLLSAENGAPLKGAEIELNSNNLRVLSNEQGVFRFEGLQPGRDYSVVPKKADFAGSGVTTHDLVLVAQHILGTRPLRTPYSLIAADVNLSKTITVLDVVLMRRLILNLDKHFPHGRAWRFVDASTRFEDPGNPWKTNFAEVRSFNNIREPVRNADFIAVKIGDVNSSAPAFQYPGPLSGRSAGVAAASLIVPALDLLPGMEAELPLRLVTPHNAEGCQFALFINPEQLEITELSYGLAKAAHINTTQLQDGWLLLSWNRDPSAEIKGSDHLLRIRVRARAGGQIASALSLDPRYLLPEAYTSRTGGDVEQLDLSLKFGQAAVKSPVLYAPAPNPAVAQATIRWALPASSEIRLLVRDSWNRTYLDTRQILPAGEHSLELHRSQFPAPGIYFITLEAGPHIFSQKIIFLE